MSGYAWISHALAWSDLVVFLTADIAEQDTETAIEALKLLKPGRPVPEEMCPKQLWNEPGRKPRTNLPGLFLASGYPIISGKAAAILRQFELGAGALYPIEGIYHSDRERRIPGEYFCWVFGNQKTAFLPQESPGKQPFGVQVNGDYVRWNLPVLPKDNQLAVSTAALESPDIWVDPLLFKSVFMSGPLGDALAEADLAKDFVLARCRVA